MALLATQYAGKMGVKGTHLNSYGKYLGSKYRVTTAKRVEGP